MFTPSCKSIFIVLLAQKEAWLDSKTNFIYFQQIDILSPNLAIHALIVSEVRVFIRTNKVKYWQTFIGYHVLIKKLTIYFI